MADLNLLSEDSWRLKLLEFSQKIITEARNNPSHLPLITGPTASGKSSLAILCARELDAVIISADSMQIYRGFDIGTAKASKREQEEIPHALIDICDPDQSYSVAAYADAARHLLSDLEKKKKNAIICGGTGQYINALLDGISYLAHDKDPELRAFLEEEAEQKGLATFWQEIKRLDPQAAEYIKPSDKRRIIRFHELYELTGLTRSEIDEKSRQGSDKYKFLPYYLDPGRDFLQERISRRCRQMLDDGLVEEVKELLVKYPDTTLQPYFGIGYREVISYLNGEYSLSEMAEWIIIHSRQYAKRQRSWFRSRTDLIRL